MHQRAKTHLRTPTHSGVVQQIVADNLEKAEGAALLCPVDRDITLHQVREGQVSRLGPVKDGPSDFGSKVPLDGQAGQMAAAP
jgi:hypothetical protein